MRYWRGVFIGACFVPLLVTHLHHLWGDEHYQHFPFVLAAVAFLLWGRIANRSRHAVLSDADLTVGTGRGARWVRRVMLVASCALLLAASAIWSPWLGTLAAILAAGAALIGCGGSSSSTQAAASPSATGRSSLLGPWLLLWLLVPLPFNMDQDLTIELQGVASRSASMALELADRNHLLSGFVIQVPEQEFLVEEACSGIHSLFVLFAFTAIYVVWQSRGLLHGAGLLVSAVLWALLVNVLRVTAIVFLEDRFGINLSEGWRHELFGMGLFVLALVMLFCTDQLLSFFFAPGTAAVPSRKRRSKSTESQEGKVEAEPSGGDTGQSHSSPVASSSHAVDRRRFRLRRLAMPGLFGCALLLQVQPFVQEFEARDHSGWRAERVSFSLDKQTMPPVLAGWRRVSFEQEDRDRNSDFGAHSDIWTYERDGRSVILSFDYPFPRFHELTLCYRNIDWRLCSRELTTVPAQQRESGTDIEATFDRSMGEQAFLIFSEFSLDGQFQRPLGKTLREMLLHRITNSRVHRKTCYQFQAFCSSEYELSEQEKQAVRELYAAGRKIVLEAVCGS